MKSKYGSYHSLFSQGCFRYSATSERTSAGKWRRLTTPLEGAGEIDEDVTPVGAGESDDDVVCSGDSVIR